MGIYKNENGIIDVVLGEKNVSIFTCVENGIPTLILSDFTDEMKNDAGFPFSFEGESVANLPHVRLSFKSVDDIDKVVANLTELSDSVKMEEQYLKSGEKNKMLSYIARMISLFSNIEYNGYTVEEAEKFISENILNFDSAVTALPEEFEIKARMNTLILMFEMLKDSITAHQEDITLFFEDEEKEVISKNLISLITLSSGVDKNSVSEVLLTLSALNKEIKELL